MITYITRKKKEVAGNISFGVLVFSKKKKLSLNPYF
jgi:hypothetical protein